MNLGKKKLNPSDLLANAFLEKAKEFQASVELLKVLKSRTYKIGEANVLVWASSVGIRYDRSRKNYLFHQRRRCSKCCWTGIGKLTAKELKLVEGNVGDYINWYEAIFSAIDSAEIKPWSINPEPDCGEACEALRNSGKRCCKIIIIFSCFHLGCLILFVMLVVCCMAKSYYLSMLYEGYKVTTL